MSKKELSVLAVLLGLGLLLSVALFAREQAARVELNTQLEALTADLDARDAVIWSLTADAAERDDTIEALTADAAERDGAIEALTADTETRAAAIESLTADAEAKDAAIESLTADAEAKDAAIESLTADAADKDAVIESLTADAADKDAVIESLTADAADKDAVIESLSADAEAKNAEIQSLSAALQERDAAIEDLTASLAEESASVESLTAELKTRDAAIESLEARIVELVGVVPTEFPGETDAMKFFLSACAEEGIHCLYRGLDADGNDRATLTVHGKIDCRVNVRYEPEGRMLRCTSQPCVSFPAIDRPELLELCNRLNVSHGNVRFYVNDWDNSVLAESLAVLTQDCEAETAGFTALCDLLDALAKNAESFLPYQF